MGKRLNALRHDLRMYRLSLRLQLKAATRLRGAFVLQVVGMIFNNIGLTIAWWFLFVSFGTINGWNGADFIGMQGVNMFIFGMVVLVSTGVFELARYVDRGIFDTFLTRPSSLLGQVCSSAVEIAALGDILLGVVFMGWYMIYIQVSLLAILAWLAAMLIGIVLMWCFVLLPFILAFYIFDSEKIGRSAWGLFLDMGIYPSGVISGGLRTY